MKNVEVLFSVPAIVNLIQCLLCKDKELGGGRVKLFGQGQDPIGFWQFIGSKKIHFV